MAHDDAANNGGNDDDADNGADEDTGEKWSDQLPLSRRNTLIAGVGLGTLSFVGNQRAAAGHRFPQTQWQRHQSAQGQYTLFDLDGLNLSVMPDHQDLHDFEGTGLVIEEEQDLNRLTVDLSEGNIDRRYLSWNHGEKALDFTGAAEWENEVDDFDGSTSPNEASGTGSVAGGGDGNDASGNYSTVPGGQGNTAEGAHSFAAGEGANASNDGSFVWASGGTNSAGDGSVVFEASGGMNIRDGDLDVEDGSLAVEDDLTARTGNAIVAENITAQNGDIVAEGGDVEGENLVARDTVDTETVTSDADLTLDPATGNEVVSESDLSVNGDLHVSGTKHFVTAVETSAGPKQVAYTAVEAGRPRTETSDIAELSDGRAEIDLPDHFGLVTSEDEPLSVQITPYASVKVHPQVIDRDPQRIVVEDFGDGPGDYTIAYTVRGVREGYENEPVIRDQ